MSTTRQQTSKRQQAQVGAKQAQAQRARRTRLGAAAALAAVAAAVIGLALTQGDEEAPAERAASGELLAGPPPWPAQAAGLEDRVSALGFPPVGDESYHAHALLSVYRDGKQVGVPADLGYDQSGAHSSLHTHTPDGVIHMEADDPYPYRLSHVMTTWGVPFGPDRLGGDTATATATADKKVHIYVNGEPASPDVELKDGDNVVVAYGAAGTFPTEPPADALQNA